MKRILSLVAGGVLALTATVSAGATPPESSELQMVKPASARFHSVRQAEAAGYGPESPCIPGEGIHYGNPSLLGDNALDPQQPELLVYDLKKETCGS